MCKTEVRLDSITGLVSNGGLLGVSDMLSNVAPQKEDPIEATFHWGTNSPTLSFRLLR
jgi:hypothetical protein